MWSSSSWTKGRYLVPSPPPSLPRPSLEGSGPHVPLAATPTLPLALTISPPPPPLSLCSADVNAIDNFNWTALHHASHAGEVSGYKVQSAINTELRSECMYTCSIAHACALCTCACIMHVYKWHVTCVHVVHGMYMCIQVSCTLSTCGMYMHVHNVQVSI